MIVIFYACVILFDVLVVALLAMVFVEKARLRREVRRLAESQTNIVELIESMDRLITEYKRVSSEIEENLRSRREELMHVIHRADRLLMELARRSDRFELAEPSLAEKAAPAQQPGETPGPVPPTQPEQIEAPEAPARPQAGPGATIAQPAEEKPDLQPPAEEASGGLRTEQEIAKRKKLVLDLFKQGLDLETIARTLRVPLGEVKLIVDVSKSKDSLPNQ